MKVKGSLQDFQSSLDFGIELNSMDGCNTVDSLRRKFFDEFISEDEPKGVDLYVPKPKECNDAVLESNKPEVYDSPSMFLDIVNRVAGGEESAMEDTESIYLEEAVEEVDEIPTEEGIGFFQSLSFGCEVDSEQSQQLKKEEQGIFLDEWEFGEDAGEEFPFSSSSTIKEVSYGVYLEDFMLESDFDTCKDKIVEGIYLEDFELPSIVKSEVSPLVLGGYLEDWKMPVVDELVVEEPIVNPVVFSEYLEDWVYEEYNQTTFGIKSLEKGIEIKPESTIVGERNLIYGTYLDEWVIPNKPIKPSIISVGLEEEEVFTNISSDVMLVEGTYLDEWEYVEKQKTQVVVQNIPLEIEKDVVVEEEPVTVEKEVQIDVPKDLRDFLRANPCSEVSYVLQFYSKKEIDKQIKLGRVYKRKGKLMI